MAEKPAFISDRPVDLDIDGLHSFAQYIQAELDSNVRPNVQSVLAQLGTPGEKAFGVDTRYDQGVRIGDYHSDCVQKGIELMRSLERGLQAIAWAAQNIANDFQSTDDLNGMDLARVDGYFNPKDRANSLEGTGLPPLPPSNQA